MSYQYHCPAIGECNKTFTFSTKEERQCSACNKTQLVFDREVPDKNGFGRHGVKVLLAVLGLAVAGGVGWWIFGRGSSGDAPIPPMPRPPASAPASASVSGTASNPASGPASKTAVPTTAPTSAPASGLASQPSSAPTRPASSTTLAETANDLVIQAAGKMAAGRLPEAEALLRNALSFDPKQPLIYYNLGIIELKRKNTRGALTQLEAAFKHGFSQFKEMDQDADLDALRNNPDFKALLAKYRK